MTTFCTISNHANSLFHLCVLQKRPRARSVIQDHCLHLLALVRIRRTPFSLCILKMMWACRQCEAPHNELKVDEVEENGHLRTNRQCRVTGVAAFSTYRFVRYQYCKHDILKTNELNLLQIDTSGSRSRGWTISFWGQEVKVRGHTTLELDLETWRRRHSRPLRSTRLSSYSTKVELCDRYCLSVVRLFVRLFVRSFCLSVCLSACLSVLLSVCFTVCLPACLPVCLSVSVCLPVCLYVCLPVCLSVCLWARLLQMQK